MVAGLLARRRTESGELYFVGGGEDSADETVAADCDYGWRVLLQQVLVEALLLEDLHQSVVLVVGDESVGVEEEVLHDFVVVASDDDLIVVEHVGGSEAVGQFAGLLVADDSHELQLLLRLGVQCVDELASLLVEARVARNYADRGGESELVAYYP